MDVNKDYYAILGVHQTAEEIVIKVAYRALAQKYHPDTSADSEEDSHQKMSFINEAYGVLSNPRSRKEYDKLRGSGTHDAGSFYEDEEGFSKNDHLKQNWDVAVKYSPELNEIERHLNRVSTRLSFTFRAYLLDTKDFSKAKKIASQMERDFMNEYFGSNPKILDFASHLIKVGNKSAARELNKVICVFGDSINHESFIKRIVSEYNVRGYSDLTEIDYTNISSTEQELVTSCAKKLANVYFSLKGSKNNWKIVRGTLVTFAYSFEELEKTANSYEKHYKSSNF